MTDVCIHGLPFRFGGIVGSCLELSFVCVGVGDRSLVKEGMSGERALGMGARIYVGVLWALGFSMPCDINESQIMCLKRPSSHLPWNLSLLLSWGN